MCIRGVWDGMKNFFAVTKEEEPEEILLYKGKFPREILLRATLTS